MLAVESLWMRLELIKGADYYKLAENVSTWKDRFENISILARIEVKGMPNGHIEALHWQ